MVRVTKNIKGANTSFDCYDTKVLVNKNSIQIKACSSIPDLTSFVSDSEWDRIFFMEGKWDKTFDIYELDAKKIMKLRLTKNKK